MPGGGYSDTLHNLLDLEKNGLRVHENRHTSHTISVICHFLASFFMKTIFLLTALSNANQKAAFCACASQCRIIMHVTKLYFLTKTWDGFLCINYAFVLLMKYY